MSHPLHGKTIAYITQRDEAYKAKVATVIESEGDNDCFLHVTHTQGPSLNIGEMMQVVADVRDKVDKIFLKPAKYHGGIEWLSVIEKANED